MHVRGTTLQQVYDTFTWDIPDRYNMGTDVCDRWADADPDRLAIIDVAPDGTVRRATFQDLRLISNRLANGLLARGVARGDRIAVLLPQCVETAVAHITSARMGCISMPLFTLFGPEALQHRLSDSGAKVLITNTEGIERVAGLRPVLPALELVICVDDGQFQALCDAASPDFTPVDTAADDPALLIYTSGTTGNPKGALHAHRVLPGHLPGVEMSHNFLPHPGDRFWTPADWAWIGGLLDVLMPALHHGISVVACRFDRFSPQAAFDLIQTHAIRNVFLPPTALKMMRQVDPATIPALNLRSVASGGESLGADLIDWGRRHLKLTINEFYGQTECNMIVTCCSDLEEPDPGKMGRAVAGHHVEIIDGETGLVVPEGQEGEIAVRAPDPVMFLGYWNNPAATEEKYILSPSGRWLLTGDRGIKDATGRICFLGRNDDVISSAGYRIGPAEIEHCLLGHPAVSMAGVVGRPDPLRGEAVCAYVVVKQGIISDNALASDIASFVRTQLSAHEYPRFVRFIDQMPMTTTGKIMRRVLREMSVAEARENS